MGPSAPLAHIDLAAAPWPGQSARVPANSAHTRLLPTPSGIGVFIGEGGGVESILTESAQLGSGRIALTARALDSGALMGVVARKVGSEASAALVCDLDPDRRAFRVGLRLVLGSRRSLRAVQRWQTHPAIPPAGTWTTLQLEWVDATVTVTIEGSQVASLHLPQLRHGGWGPRVLARPTAQNTGDCAVEVSRITLHRVGHP